MGWGAVDPATHKAINKLHVNNKFWTKEVKSYPWNMNPYCL